MLHITHVHSHKDKVSIIYRLILKEQNRNVTINDNIMIDALIAALTTNTDHSAGGTAHLPFLLESRLTLLGLTAGCSSASVDILGLQLG